MASLNLQASSKWRATAPAVLAVPFCFGILLSLALACSRAVGSQSATANQYHLVKRVVLGGDGGWDYFTTDAVTHRIFIARGTHMMVVDPEGKVLADVPHMQGAHAVEFTPNLNLARFTATEADATQAVLSLGGGNLDEAAFTAWLRTKVKPDPA